MESNDERVLDLSFWAKLYEGAGTILTSVRRKNPEKTELRQTIYEHKLKQFSTVDSNSPLPFDSD